MLPRHHFDSTCLAWMEYDSAIRRLHLAFVSGEVYCYEGVPWAVYRGLDLAPSKGRYFQQHVRDRFACTHLDAEAGIEPPHLQR
jgi:hypothetical protein